MERLFLCLEAQGIEIEDKGKMDIFVGSIGDNSARYAQKLTHQLRKLGVSADYDKLSRSVKAQMKQANKLGCRYSVIIGDDEISGGKIMLKNMELGESTEVSLNTEAISENIK